MYAARRQAMDNFQSTVLGHLHANGCVHYVVNTNNRVFGMSVGCGVDRSHPYMQYGATYSRKPALGCGVVVDGASAYFEPWLLPSKN
jgi:hypothetical protein